VIVAAGLPSSNGFVYDSKIASTCLTCDMQVDQWHWSFAHWNLQGPRNVVLHC